MNTLYPSLIPHGFAEVVTLDVWCALIFPCLISRKEMSDYCLKLGGKLFCLICPACTSIIITLRVTHCYIILMVQRASLYTG